MILYTLVVKSIEREGDNMNEVDIRSLNDWPKFKLELCTQIHNLHLLPVEGFQLATDDPKRSATKFIKHEKLNEKRA
jgi:hypothetical protein